MKNLYQKGETIVEVLLSIVVLGFTISVVFVIARNSLFTGQAASERTQVLTTVESQIESLKYLATLENSTSGDGVFGQGDKDFCINPSNNLIMTDLDITPANCGLDAFPDVGIFLKINYNANGPDGLSDTYDDDTFTITTEWTRVGGNSGSEKERLIQVVRIHPNVTVAQIRGVGNCTSQPNINLSGLVYEPKRLTSLDVVWFEGRNKDPTTGKWLGVAGNTLSTRSDPDILLPSDINITQGCEYKAKFTTYCTAAVLSGGNYVAPSTCGRPPNNTDQHAEAARFDLYSISIGDETNAKCGGNRLATFTTFDVAFNLNNPQIEWSGTVDVDVLESGTVSCMEIVHVCEFDQALCQAQTSSVYFHSIDWIGTQSP